MEESVWRRRGELARATNACRLAAVPENEAEQRGGATVGNGLRACVPAPQIVLSDEQFTEFV
jgi:hypothetical protein